MPTAGKNPTGFADIRHPPPFKLTNNAGLCTADLPIDISMSILSLMYLAFGLIYTFFGYRCFKAINFLTGFSFATAIVYTLCMQEYLLPHAGNVLVSMCAGVLFGLITMLIQYIALFINGFHIGFLLAVAGLAIYDHILTVYPTTYWLCIVTMACTAILFAVLNLYWKKGLTVFGTSVYGAAITAVSLDYFIERMEMLKWLWNRAKLEPAISPPCPNTWMLLCVWPALTVVGITAQWLITGRGIYHDISVQAQNRRMEARCHPRTQNRALTREQRDEIRENQYRYLYRIRTAHGDVISQAFVKALQNKVRPNAESPWIANAAGEFNTLQSDTTHLTVLAGSDHHHESDDEIRHVLRHNTRSVLY